MTMFAVLLVFATGWTASWLAALDYQRGWLR